ncbi:MAG: amidohydrolase family protein [Candidatus Marinimicrobia bacterium]|nr:amidohydrolase family protein [Candidatus Neomarinimicrobiota bacterium]
MSSLLIKNGLVIHADGQRHEDILIQDETIVTVGQQLDVNRQPKIIDASGKWIFPGVIDPHTHMGIPIKSGISSDDFSSGSRSALHGGVTTILDFTILEAGQSLSESLAVRKKLAEEAFCDVGLHINITRFEPEILAEIPSLISMGFNSFKVFTTYKEAGMMLGYEQIKTVAKIIGSHGGVLMVHAEDDQVITQASAVYAGQHKTHPRYHGLSRPAEAELRAIEKLGRISELTGCTIYIVHLNTAAGLAEASNFPLLKVETCPHYLLLDESAYEREDGRMFVSSPPLRKAADQAALWQGIQDGQIHTVGSDHCPFCLDDKPRDIPFQDIPNGMGGVETLFPTLLAEFIKRGLDLGLLSKLTSHNPAEIFGLQQVKGSLSLGVNADLLIIDPSASSTGWEKDLDTTLDWNAYAGLPALFPETVIRRGEVIVSDGPVLTPTKGRLLRSMLIGQK